MPISIALAFVLMVLSDRTSLACTIFKGHTGEDDYGREEPAHGRVR